MDGIQIALKELVTNSPLGSSNIAPLLQDLNGANPSPTEAILIALALNTTHMVHSLGERISKLELSQANNQPPPNSNPQQLSQIQATLSSLSEKVQFQSKRTLITNTTNTAPPSKKIKKSFAEIVSQAPTPTDSQEKAPTKNAAKKSADPKDKGPKPLPTAERRFFATRLSTAPFAESAVLAATLSVAIGHVLRTAQFPSSQSVALSATINNTGTVTFTANPFTPASTFIPYFTAILNTLNKACPIGDNPFNPLRTAPTDVNVAIHNIPTFAVPTESSELANSLSEAILYAADIQITGARFLKTDPEIRATKKTTTVVITCSPSNAKKIGTSIKLFSRPRKANIMWSASSTTQCKKCWKFGRATAGCKSSESMCPICSQNHPRHLHRCSIPTCPGGGADKPTVNCCPNPPPKCINCNGKYTATDLQCPSRKSTQEKSSIKSNTAPAADTSMSTE